MNFLAHCALAHDAADHWSCSDDERLGLLAGAVIGEFVKGKIPADWPVPLQAGARLHRKVDALSNQNIGIRTSCNRYPDHLRRFAPIFVDMLADHSLSLAWTDFYALDKEAFSRECYQAIDLHKAYLPPMGMRFLDYMQEVDLLASYHEWHHVARGLKSVLRRLNRSDMFEDVEATSLTLTDHAHADFAEYYPELQQAWQTWNAFSVAPQN